MNIIPDPEVILQTLQVISRGDPGTVVEIRLLPRKKKDCIIAGYFDPPAFKMAATRLIPYLKQGLHNVYVTLNVLNPALLGRYYRRFEVSPERTTTDAEVTRYRWILMDFDPVRPSGINATDEEMQTAMDLAAVVKAYCVNELEMHSPLECFSGNGVHHLYPEDMPANGENIAIVKNLLSKLADQFNNEYCKLDKANFNPARITKLYGTVSGKGDNTPSRPNRLSKITYIPNDLEVIS